MKLQTKIYGCHSRDKMIEDYKKELGGNLDITYDDRENGGNAYYTIRKALLSPINEDTTHLLVLPDDMQLCNNFLEKLEFIVNKFPKKIISLYPCFCNSLGHIYNTPYHRVVILAAGGLVFPVQIIKEMIEWIDNCYTKYTRLSSDTLIDDVAIQAWAKDYSVDMITIIPALVQHIGDNSLLGDFPIRKTNFFIDDLTEEQLKDVDWNSNDILQWKYNNSNVFPLPGTKVEKIPLIPDNTRIITFRYSSLGNTFI